MRKKFSEGSSNYWYATESGDKTKYGTKEFSVLTRGLGRFAFFSENQDNGKWMLTSPGSSVEVLGESLKAKGNEGPTSQRAKEIFAKHGDIVLEAPDGEIILKAKNVRIVADGGGDDGDVTINANHIINVKSGHDIRLQANNTLALTSTKEMNVITEGFYSLSYGFAAASSSSDFGFGSLGPIFSAFGLKLPSL